MILTRRAALDGVQLDELHDAIVIRGIEPGTPNETLQATGRMGGAGQRVTVQHWDMLEAKVTFAIDIPKREMAARREVFDLVKGWALSKGWLTVNERPDRRMHVDKVIFPDAGDLWDWTRDYTIAFRAYGVPFWQDEAPASAVTQSITNGTAVITVPGDTETVLDLKFENISGQNIANFAVTAGGNEMTLTGVNLAARQALVISHTPDGLLTAKKGTADVYALIRGADDLNVKPGEQSVKITATRAGRLTLSCAGRYL